jgi:hypothetical protein
MPALRRPQAAPACFLCWTRRPISPPPPPFPLHCVPCRCNVTAPNGLNPGAQVVINIYGVVTKEIISGEFKYQVYENGVAHYVASGQNLYFNCTINSCDPTQPIGLFLTNPNSVPTTFTGVVPLSIPQPQKTGQYNVVFWGEDQDHGNYDLSGALDLVQTCTTNADCPPPPSYCKNGPGNFPPYTCQ